MTLQSDTKHAEIILAAEELGLVCCWSEPINVGDMYLAKRNGPVQLLTAKEVRPEGWINPVETLVQSLVLDAVVPGAWLRSTVFAYAFDIWECCKVVEVDDTAK